MKKFREKLEKRWLKRITKWAEPHGMNWDGSEAWIGENQLLEIRFVEESDGLEVHFNLTQLGEMVIGMVAKAFMEESIKSLFANYLKEQRIIKADDGLYYQCSKIESVCCVLEKESKAAFWVKSYAINTKDGSAQINGFLREFGYLTPALKIKRGYDSLQSFTRGDFEKDLFWPIKKGVNGYFFTDHYYIRDFYVVPA